MLAEGKAIVLFDGLDEVNMEGDQRRTLVRRLQDFADQYSASQVLITCRIAASDYLFEHFSNVEVADFEYEQIHIYARKWFGADGDREDEAAEKKHKAFIADLYTDENEGIRELCSSPLLLAMLCLAYDETGYFPGRRAELYEDATEALLRKWDATRNIRRDEIYQELSHRRRQQLLSHIAMRTFEAGEYFIERRVLEKQIGDYLRPLSQNQDLDANATLRAIAAQHGFLVERARDIYSFSNLTFQEYFAAKYVVDNEARGAAGTLVRSHLNDNRWREVILLTASLLYDADEFFKAMREAIDAGMSGDEQLVKLFYWADRHSEEANVLDERRSAVRLAYITLARDPALDLALACDPALAGALAYGFRLGSDYALLYAWQIAAILAAVRDWNLVSVHANRYPADFEQVISMVEQTGDAATARRLRGLALPASDQRQDTWSSFADGLRTVMREERDIGHDWQFSQEQWEKLNAYLAANKFLIDCLDLAYVSDRQAILNGLLAPPA